jgi:hypothetical protein
MDLLFIQKKVLQYWPENVDKTPQKQCILRGYLATKIYLRQP